MFEKNHKLSQGRPKGAKNKEDLNSLRKLLEGSFHDNRLVIRDMLDAMYANTKKHIEELNRRIAELETTDDLYTDKLRDWTHARTSLLREFKWLLELKASLEPKSVEVTGKDGEALFMPPVINIVAIEANAETNPVMIGEGMQTNRIESVK